MREKRWVPFALCSAAALLGAAVYFNAIGNPFVWDDRRTIVENLSIRGPLDWRAVFYHDRFRPLVNLSYAADYAVGGLSVAGYHVTSILLHALNVVLLFLVTRRLVGVSDVSCAGPDLGSLPLARRAPRKPQAARRGKPGPDGLFAERATLAAFGAAAIFAVHPMLTQAVGYVSGRAEVLCAVFFLSALLAAQSWIAGGRVAWLAAVAGAWALALASKEVAVALPVVLGAYALLAPRLAPTAKRRLACLAGAMLVLMVGVATYRLNTLVRVENSARAAFAWSNVLLGVDSLRRYATMMVVPAGQSIFHSAGLKQVTSPGAVLFNLTVLAAILSGAWKMRRSEPAGALGLAWFLILLVPSTLLLVIDIGEPMAEQRVYLGACGFAIAAGSSFARLHAWLRARGPALGLVGWSAFAAGIVTLSVLTVNRNSVWHDAVSLWTEATRREPNVWVPYFGLGDALRERGEHARAAEAYLEAVRLKPDEPRTYVPLATSLLMSGRPAEAEKYFEQAERMSPGGVEAPVGRALAARMAGRQDEARERLEAVARAHADAVLPRRLLAEMYERDYGDRAAALRACEEVRALAPATPGVDDCVRRNQQPR